MVKSEREESEFTEIFERFLKDYQEWPEILEIAKKNSYNLGREGKIWIIGGFVYRPIIKELHGEIPEPSQTDIDFLIERGSASEEVYAPKGWDVKRTEAGYFYLEKGNIRIDPNYLYSFHSIISRHTIPEMQHFFPGTPLDIQSIAYDITDRNVGVIGRRGIEAILGKIVRVNNLEEAIFEAEKRKISVEDLVKQKSKELNFGYDLTRIHQIPDINENHKKNGKTTVKG